MKQIIDLIQSKGKRVIDYGGYKDMLAIILPKDENVIDVVRIVNSYSPRYGYHSTKNEDNFNVILFKYL